MLPWVRVSAGNDRDNGVCVSVSADGGTVSERSGTTERDVFLRMLCNVSWKHEAISSTCLSLAAEHRLRIESCGRCREYRIGGLCRGVHTPSVRTLPEVLGAASGPSHTSPSFLFVESTSVHTRGSCRSSHTCRIVPGFSGRNCCFNP